MKYICYYDIPEYKVEKRRYVLSATNKIQYILSALENATDDSIDIISCSPTQTCNFCKGRKTQISEKISLKLFSSFGRKSVLTKLLDRIFIPIKLFFSLCIDTSKNETVIVYHSPAIITAVRVAKKIKKFRLILEFEELYGDVSGDSRLRNKELKIAKDADAYIVPTKLLNLEINPDRKPSIVIHGTYQVETERKCVGLESKLYNENERTIHCVYAGTFDLRKGAVAAVLATQFLPSNYHVHILGFGTETDTKQIKDIINDVAKKNLAKVTFDGLLSGEDYIQFIQSCDIGLSTQNPDADFNATSFPSKILSYLSNGLRVVSIRIPAIETSAVGSELFFYDEQTPEAIAKAILSVNIFDDYDSRKLISELSEQFIDELKTVI